VAIKKRTINEGCLKAELHSLAECLNKCFPMLALVLCLCVLFFVSCLYFRSLKDFTINIC